MAFNSGNPIKIKLLNKTPRIIIKQVGSRGEKGEQGDPGEGVPQGGLSGQVISKASNADYDVEWIDPSFGDKNFTQDFTVSSLVEVNHNLNKYPAVTVTDSAGDMVEGEVQYISTSQLLVSFSSPFSGKVTCN